MRVLAAYGLQFGRYRITQIAKQKKQYDNTKDIVLDVWRGVLLAAPGMAHLAEVLQSRLWVHGDIIGCSNKDHSNVVGAVISGSIVTEELL